MWVNSNSVIFTVVLLTVAVVVMESIVSEDGFSELSSRKSVPDFTLAKNTAPPSYTLDNIKGNLVSNLIELLVFNSLIDLYNLNYSQIIFLDSRSVSRCSCFHYITDPGGRVVVPVVVC